MECLKSLRVRKGLLQKEVAKEIGVDRTTYVKYENGSSEPSFEIIQRIADLFGVTIDHLLGYTGHSKMSDIFKRSLSKFIERERLCGDLTEPEARADFEELSGYAESPFVLTIDEIFRASDLAGESIDDMLTEDYEPGVFIETERSSGEVNPTPEDVMCNQIMSLVVKMPEEQKVLLLSLLQTTVERNQGTLLSVQASAPEEAAGSDHRSRT